MLQPSPSVNKTICLASENIKNTDFETRLFYLLLVFVMFSGLLKSLNLGLDGAHKFLLYFFSLIFGQRLVKKVLPLQN